MHRMADPTNAPGGVGRANPTAPPAPGERRLAHPPSDRYRVAHAAFAPEPEPAAWPGRGRAFGTIAGVAGAAAIIALGSVLTVTAGLLVVAAATGWAVGMGLRVGAGGPRASGGQARSAVAITLVAIGLGQLGLWSYALSEGGVLAPLDFLWQVYGGLVPVEFGVAAVTAWLAAR
jgi:hypothetical protein